MLRWIAIGLVVMVGYFWIKASRSSETTIRVISNQWIANKQLGDISDEKIYDLILRNRYRIKEGKFFPRDMQAIIEMIKWDIETDSAFYRNYTLTLLLYTIFLIENNKEFINHQNKYSYDESVFEKISNRLKENPSTAKYSDYK